MKKNASANFFSKDGCLVYHDSPHSPHTIIPSLIRPHKTVLDVGCNIGMLAQHLRNNEVDGIDILDSALKQAKKYCKHTYKRDLYAGKLNIPAKKYDYIVFSDILEHLPRPDLILADVMQYLKPKGQILISFPNIARIELRIKHLLGNFDYEPGIMGFDHLRFFTKKSATELINNAGYSVTKTIPTGLGHMINMFTTLTAFQFVYVCTQSETFFPEVVYPYADNCMLAYDTYIADYANTIQKSKVLDIGCALGNHTAIFAKNGNEVYGLDIQDLRLKEYIPAFTFTKYKGKKFPYKDNMFDLITSFDVIEHVEDDELFVKEMYRVLKKGGKIITATPNRNRIASLLLTLIGKRDVFPKIMQEEGIGGKSVHMREYTKNELITLFKDAKFKHITVDGCWMGIRGNYDIGTDTFVIPELAQTLFIKAKK